MSDRYWVGNSGNWSDNTNHWSATSGGAGGASKPTISDNVFFDANSFSPGDKIVTLDENALCLSMNWTGATNTPVFAMATYYLTIGANLTLIEDMSVTTGADTVNGTRWSFLAQANGTYYIDTAGQSLVGDLFIDGNAVYSTSTRQAVFYTLTNDLIVTRIAGAAVQNGRIYIDEVTFDSAGYEVNAPGISIAANSSGANTVVFMRDSLWKVTTYSGWFGVSEPSGANPVTTSVYAGGSTILFYTTDDGAGSTSSTFYDEISGTYNRIVVRSPDAATGDDYFFISLYGTPGTYAYVKSFEIYGYAGKNVEFDESDFSNPAYLAVKNFRLDGESNNLVTFAGDSAQGDTVLYKYSGTAQLNYCDISFLSVGGGATWYACNSTDSGNNDGLTWSCEATAYQLEGEPVETGIYTLGRHSRDYPLVLDFTYPISERDGSSFVLSGVEIGSILIDGNDIYVSWKRNDDGTFTYGVDKVDTSNKLNGAYLETRVLSGNREQYANFRNFIVSYSELPANTGIALKYSKDYGQNWIDMTEIDDTDRQMIYAESEAVEGVVLQIRMVMTTSGDNAPAIERGDIFLS